MNGRVAGKVVLVTGGASDIGLACAQACARERATVVITAVNMEGVFLDTREAIRVMEERGGSIVNISSIEGIIGEPLTAACDASKGGVPFLASDESSYLTGSELVIDGGCAARRGRSGALTPDPICASSASSTGASPGIR